jgi:cyanophycinase
MKAQTLPGNVLIVGGGGETIGGWSDEPYSWAVEQSGNKRVVIVGAYTDVTDWLPDYFMEHCGAAYARNFPITSSANANAVETYDTLLTYDIIFFRGGDQYDYYSLYKGTLTEQAAQEVFDRGGVIAGTSAGLHILSEVMFIARYGSVYPEEALEDPYNQYMTLADDFLNLVPGVLFDSHVAERGRFGRLIGMLGRWDLDGHDDIVGIGVDDKTAFCIYPDMMAAVYGTGAVNIYREGDDNNFSISGDKLLASDLMVMQLLSGCTVNLNTFEFEGLDQLVLPGYYGETFPGHLWMSGSDTPADNQHLLDQLAVLDMKNDSVLIITCTNTSTAEELANYLLASGQIPLILEASAINGNNENVRQDILNAQKYVFTRNDYQPFMDFLYGTSNGMLLYDDMHSGQKALAFLGGDSRFAGKIALKNYEEEYASYEGLLDFRDGLGLLDNTIVMPNTFSQQIDLENAATGLPYGMVLNNLRYGVWLYDNNFVHYTWEGTAIELRSYGEFPMILAENKGTEADFAEIPATGSGNPRNIAGFGNFIFRLMDETVSLQLDYVGNIPGSERISNFFMTPNPVSEQVVIKTSFPRPFLVRILSSSGQEVFQRLMQDGQNITLAGWQSGVYQVLVCNQNGSYLTHLKLIVR